MNQLEEASLIRNKNVIDIAISFSAMNRVLEEGSKLKIAGELEHSVCLLAGIRNKADFEKFHSAFCDWFIQNINTAKKTLKNGKIKESRAASYGQAAKVLNVALKVYIYYCNLPNCEVSAKILPMLHCAVDTIMMKHLKMKYPRQILKAVTIEAVGKSEYFLLQNMVNQHIEDEFDNLILPVHYDDIMWYRLNRLT